MEDIMNNQDVKKGWRKRCIYCGELIPVNETCGCIRQWRREELKELLQGPYKNNPFDQLFGG